MPILPYRFRQLLLLLGGLNLLRLVAFHLPEVLGARDLVYAGTSPVGGDFINLFTAGRLVLRGQIETIYQPDLFMAFERGIIPHYIGVRLWAYPPHSLLFAWPFGLFDYVGGLLAWSLLGLVVLALGARRLGFGWLETGVILLSPATLSCLDSGQTGNLFLGLLLIAVSSRDAGRVPGGLAAALLTLKPQLGFMLPVLLLRRRHYRAFAVAAVASVGLVVASVLLFGIGSWIDYFGRSASFLGLFERTGRGMFMLMEPSVFMAGRILTGNADLASVVHGLVAVPVGAFVVWRVLRSPDADQQAAVVLAGTALITPYFHVYDAGSVLCAALLALRRRETGSAEARLAGYVVAVLAWGLPDLTEMLNLMGLPLGPLVLLAVLLLAAGPRHRALPQPA